MIAILSEIAGTVCLKLSLGFTQKIFSFAFVVFYIISFLALGLALKKNLMQV